MTPHYLKQNTKVIFQKNGIISLSVFCDCGTSSFDLFCRKPTPEMKLEEKEATKRIKRDFGSSFSLEMKEELYIVKRFLGFALKKRKYSDYAIKHPFFHAVVAQCSNCGKPLVLFDEESTQSGHEPTLEIDTLELKHSHVSDITLTLYYDDPTTEGDFSRIVIKGVVNGKKITLGDFEV